MRQACAGYVYADSIASQSAIYRVGCTGVPIVNANINRSTGSAALYLARQAVEAGAADCVLVVGFDLTDQHYVAAINGIRRLAGPPRQYGVRVSRSF